MTFNRCRQCRRRSHCSVFLAVCGAYDRCPVETLRSEILSLNDQMKSAWKRLASIDAIFRNKFTLFLQAGLLFALHSNMYMTIRPAIC